MVKKFLTSNHQLLISSVRPPVVVVLGHVDHGKTSILDKIRKTKVAEGETGGITQHIGAYQVRVGPSGDSGREKLITFLDTPGHEAFSAIRSRGAKVADVAVLVIAAEEGVKPQTKEAIRHIQEAKLAYVVALNKIDKPAANPQKVKQELAEEQVFVEGWGGDVPLVELSAKTGAGIDNLMEMILLVADLGDLKADNTKLAQGVVIESHLDNQRGFVATLLVQDGVLKVGDYVTSGGTWAKLKSLEDFKSQRVNEALPSCPVVTTGWSEAPDIGEQFFVVSSKLEAEKKIKTSLRVEKPLFVRTQGLQTSNKKWLDVIFKADVLSSLEAIDQAIKDIDHEEVGYKVRSYGSGSISDQDIKTALVSKGIVYGFHVDVKESVKRVAEKEGVKIRTFNIIYELIEALRKDLSELLDPEIQRTDLGRVQILKTFKNDGRFQVIGGRVTKGVVKRAGLVEVIRGGVKQAMGRIVQLQQNKQDASEVKEGLECGMKFEEISPSKSPFIIKEGDILEVYEEKKIPRSI